jgi:hypothetical protein
MGNQISRRAFLGQTAVAPAAGIAATPERPQEAWVIVATNWQYNDEYTYPEGEEVLPKVYFDQQAAEEECRRMCEQFFAGQTPLDFEVDFESYRHELPKDVTEETVTWEQLCSAGFPAPYYVQEMET